MNLPIHVLIIEDNGVIAAQLGEYLGRHCVVDYAANGTTALALAEQQSFDVILLDLNLPGMDGLEVCRRLKSRDAALVPILMLTARDSLDDKLSGFATGADDYLTKPYALPEVLARCQALARRHQLHQARTVNIGPLAICRQSREATRDGRRLALSETDFQLLLALVEAHPAAISRTDLIRTLWGDQQPDSDALKSHVYTLRLALDRPFAFPMLRTVHAVGYRLAAQP